MPHMVLVTGALGQIGSELIPELEMKYSHDTVLKLDINYPGTQGQEIQLDVVDAVGLSEVIKKYDIKEIYHLAAILSANGEKDPSKAWEINIQGLRNILELAKEHSIKVFWPSSIAVFGPTTPADNTPQFTVTVPTTMYGITKITGEYLCQYYCNKYGVDVRSVRFPGLISYVSPPGGGTTDFAVEIFYHALENKRYTCFLSGQTTLPMMYMPDALRAVAELMEAPADSLFVRTSYNLSGLSFSAEELATEIQKHMQLEVEYKPDFRQAIADSWPNSIDDSVANKDWGWEARFKISEMVQDMLANIKRKLDV